MGMSGEIYRLVNKYSYSGNFRESLRGSKKLLSLESERNKNGKELVENKNGKALNGDVSDAGYANNAYVVGETLTTGSIDWSENELVRMC